MNKKQYKSLKIDDKVHLSESYLNFFKDAAYEFNVISGTQTMEKHSAEGSFFAYLLLGNRYPYKATVTERLSEVGEGPGARIRIVFPHGQVYNTIVGYRDLRKGNRK
jgi:hypothetical protein